MLLSRQNQDVSRYSANNNLKSVPKKAVLSVPLSFSPNHCKSLHTAATLAGFEVIGTAYDVSCVSLAFAVREKDPQTVCLLDVGHEFTSAQVVSIDPANSTLTVLATASRGSSTCGASAFRSVQKQKKVLCDWMCAS